MAVFLYYHTYRLTRKRDETRLMYSQVSPLATAATILNIIDLHSLLFFREGIGGVNDNDSVHVNPCRIVDCRGGGRFPPLHRLMGGYS